MIRSEGFEEPALVINKFVILFLVLETVLHPSRLKASFFFINRLFIYALLFSATKPLMTSIYINERRRNLW